MRELISAAVAAVIIAAWAAPAQSPPDSTHRLEDLSRAFRYAYKQAKPAVVLVATARTWRLPRFHPQVPEEEYQGMGSGTIVSPDGHILSNYHVIAGADSIAVTLADRRTFTAEVVGFDSLIDIALLKIDAQKLPTVPLADSDRLQIGDWVLAIGHPLGMGSTLTHGIVSALGRQAGIFDPSSEENRYAIESFIQTNAVINPGNSGGPLLDLHGRVVGINTAISTHTRFYIGYSLAVPINLAQKVVDDLLTHGRIVRGYLGVSMENELTQELIADRGLALDRPRGVYLSGVKPQSPAARGGLRDGDVILSIDDTDINHSNQIQTLIYGRDPGDAIELQILRDNEPLQLSVILSEREDDRRMAQGHQRISRLGLSVEQLPANLAAELGFDHEVATTLGFGRGEEPVVVVAVDPGGMAAAKGIKPRDIITEIDQERVTSLQHLVRFVSELDEGHSALFWFWRPDDGIDVRALMINDSRIKD